MRLHQRNNQRLCYLHNMHSVLKYFFCLRQLVLLVEHCDPGVATISTWVHLTTEPGGPDFKYREAAPEELVNPYAKSKGSQNTMKWCAWEVWWKQEGDATRDDGKQSAVETHLYEQTRQSQVLRDNPRGLTVKSIVEEIERRRLRSFEGKANPTGQVWDVGGMYTLLCMCCSCGVDTPAEYTATTTSTSTAAAAVCHEHVSPACMHG